MDVMTFNQFNAEMMVMFDREASDILKKNYWCVLNSFTYYVTTKPSKEWVTIPKGYLTDGASVPRLFWSLLPPWGKYGQAVVVHDYLCEFPYLETKDGPIEIDRKRVDEILAECLKVLNVSAWRRHLMMSGVNAHRVVIRPGKPEINHVKHAIETKRAEQNIISKFLGDFNNV